MIINIYINNMDVWWCLTNMKIGHKIANTLIGYIYIYIYIYIYSLWELTNRNELYNDWTNLSLSCSLRQLSMRLASTITKLRNNSVQRNITEMTFMTNKTIIFPSSSWLKFTAIQGILYFWTKFGENWYPSAIWGGNKIVCFQVSIQF